MRFASHLQCVPVAVLIAYGPSTLQLQSAPRPYVVDLRIVSNETTPGMQLTYISDLITNDKGLAFTSHSRPPEIRVFDASGKLLRKFGRSGQGPGEFAGYIRFGATIGDTVVVIDGNHNVAIYFRSDGTLIRMEQPRGAWADRTVVTPLLPDRSLVRIGHLSPMPGSKPDSEAFVITDSLGKEIQRISHTATPNFFLKFQSGAASIIPQPFIATVKATTDHSGTRGLVALPHTEWGGKPGQVKLLVIDRTGVVAERILSLEARKTSPEDVNAFVERYRGMRSSLDATRGVTTTPEAVEKQLRDSLIVPEYLPSVADVVMGRDGSIWVRPYWSLTDWTVLAPAGTRTFTVRLPAAVPTSQLHEVSMDRFWTVAPDSDGLPIITRYRFTGP